jgi:hypothetical protein
MTEMKHPQWKIIDTFDQFLSYWSSAHSIPMTQQIERWQTSYMAKYPKLLEKQVLDYESQGLDWREIAKEKVFPKLSESLPLMQEARENLLAVCGPIYERALQVLGFDFKIVFVIYVGLGCGAGWATRYESHPACLFGLENIAESGWHTHDRLQGLVAHEIGHLAHMAWRGEWDSFAEAEQDPFFQLYSEGFAQRCEHLILGDETWHQAQDESWLPWCKQHKGWLAREYLRRIGKGKFDSIRRDFFGGPWFDIQGKRQTGYFLGHEFIRWLEREDSLREIAIYSFEDVRERAAQYLQSPDSA